MNIEKTGALVSRAAGVVLIVIGTSSLLSWPVFEPSGMATSGWTSYSPLATNITTDLMTHLHDTYYAASSNAAFYLPGAAQAVAGLAMVLLSKPIGRWLARGLNDTDIHNPG